MVKHWRITKNKTLEIQLEKWKKHWNWFDVSIRWTRRQDHAGLQLNFELMGLYVHVWLCDNRHWSVENNDWLRSDVNLREDVNLQSQVTDSK